MDGGVVEIALRIRRRVDATISAVTPAFPHRASVPARLIWKGRQLRQRIVRLGKRTVRLVRPEVSQARLKQFLGEMERRPRPGLPLEQPGSLAVVVPCFRHAAYLPAMLASIVAQTRLPDEVIFVDDGSPDTTRELLEEFLDSQQVPVGCLFTLLVNARNIGQAASLNRGISAASSDLIMILNDDDYLLHDAIDATLTIFGRNRGLALVGARCVGFAGDEELAVAEKFSSHYSTDGQHLAIQRPEEVPSYRNYNDLNMTHSGSCFFKVAWDSVGGYCVDRRRRVVPFADRDFQLRVNAVWPVAVAHGVPLALWRTDSSVDEGRYS